MARNPSLAGRVTVNLTISANGHAVRSTDQEMNTPTPDLEICVAGRVKTWAFPKPEGGDTVKVALPFSFR